MTKNNDEKILAAALLWLRNHYELGNDDLKDQVITIIDRVLKFHHPDTASYERFVHLFIRHEFDND